MEVKIQIDKKVLDEKTGKYIVELQRKIDNLEIKLSIAQNKIKSMKVDYKNFLNHKNDVTNIIKTLNDKFQTIGIETHDQCGY